jgi:uncharacterized protein
VIELYAHPACLKELCGLIPSHGGAIVAHTTITLNYTTVLNVIFLVIAALLVRRFLKTGGPHMIRMMDHPMGA